jgi:HSP20 family protein
MPHRKDIDRLKSEMEEIFADLCQVPRLIAQRAGFRPAIDVYRTEEPPAIVVVVELAGIDPAEVELAVSEGILVVQGRRRREARERRTYQHMEIDYGAFTRRIRLPEPVDTEEAQATYARGLLSIHLPVATRTSGPVRVPITTARSA